MLPGVNVSGEKQVWKKGEGWRDQPVKNSDDLVNYKHFKYAKTTGLFAV